VPGSRSESRPKPSSLHWRRGPDRRTSVSRACGSRAAPWTGS